MSGLVYKAITAVMAEMAKEGISKDRRNQQQGYSFRGIDDVYNALSPIMAKHGLCMLPRMLSREMTERVTAKGSTLFYTVVEAEFDLVAAEDGSMHTIRAYGEAMDSADKSTNKAMSAAYKYAAMQAFCIPTEGDHDADATTHEVAPQPKAPAVDLAAVLKAMDEAPTLEALAATSEAAAKLKGADKNEARKRFLGRQASLKAAQMREHQEFVAEYDNGEPT